MQKQTLIVISRLDNGFQLKGSGMKWGKIKTVHLQ